MVPTLISSMLGMTLKMEWRILTGHLSVSLDFLYYYAWVFLSFQKEVLSVAY